MKTINPHFISSLLDPLTGLADDDEANKQYRDFNPNDEQKVRLLIRSVLVPYYERFDLESQQIAKASLGYYLSTSRLNFHRFFYSHLLPFGATADPRQFFVWLWEELFNKEPYMMTDPDEYEEVNDVNATHSIKLAPTV